MPFLSGVDVFKREMGKVGMLTNPKDIAERKAMNSAQRCDVRLEAIAQ